MTLGMNAFITAQGFAKQGMLSKLYAGGASIEDIEYGPEAVTVTAVVDAPTRGALRDYDTCPPKMGEDWED